jgi:hypothetical protein
MTFGSMCRRMMRPLGELAPDREHRVERGHRLLEDHADLPAANAAHLLLAEAEKVAFLVEDFAAFDAAGGFGDQRDRLTSRSVATRGQSSITVAMLRSR